MLLTSLPQHVQFPKDLKPRVINCLLNYCILHYQFIMSAKRLLEMTHARYDCKEELKRTQARLQKQEQLVECLEGEVKALRGDNDQLRYELLCSNCQRYLDGKQPGDTILALPCHACMGTEGYTKNWSRK